MGLYLNEHWRLRSFSGNSKGGKSTIRIEIETVDCAEFGFFLSGLAEIERRQTVKPPPKRRRETLLLAAPGEVGQ